MPGANESKPQILASSWYAEKLGPGTMDVQEMLEARFPAALLAVARKLPMVRGALIAFLAAPNVQIVLTRGEPGALTALRLMPLRGHRAVVLELIPTPLALSARFKRPLHRFWRWAFEAPALRRGMSAGQVLTEKERDECARTFGVAETRLQYLPWAWSREGRPSPAEGRSGVFASGRAYCDWETLLEAVEGHWALTLACSAEDLPRVSKLTRGRVRTRVLAEIPRGEHDELVRGSAVYVIPILDISTSAGQVRLMTATEAGTSVVASRVRALDDYAIDGVTAVLVPPGDPAALRAAVNRLLQDPELRERLSAAALKRAEAWTYERYFQAVRMLIEDAFQQRQIAARSPLGPSG